MDVTLCTSSILHLCCISVDRYYAIVDRPLLYYDRITTARVVIAIICCWKLAALTGFVPVFTGIYSTDVHLQNSVDSIVCDLVVNKYFSVIAGMISFWVPAVIIVYVYAKVYIETRKLARRSQANVVLITSTAANGEDCVVEGIEIPSASEDHHDCLNGKNKRKISAGRGKFLSGSHGSLQADKEHRERESGAAVTLGIVVGAFLVCWLPFFIWMPLTSLLELETPRLLYNIILWIGYVNSALNPFIYGLFNREFKTVMLNHVRKCSTSLQNSFSV